MYSVLEIILKIGSHRVCANLDLKCAMVGTLTTSWGREFQWGMTRHEKKRLRNSV